jgi:hypothetical protein
MQAKAHTLVALCPVAFGEGRALLFGASDERHCPPPAIFVSLLIAHISSFLHPHGQVYQESIAWRQEVELAA